MITEKFQLGVEAQFARMLFVVVVLFYVSWTTTVVSYSAEREGERGRERKREREREGEREGGGEGEREGCVWGYSTQWEACTEQGVNRVFQFCLLFVPAAVYNTFTAIQHTAPSGHGTIQ